MNVYLLNPSVDGSDVDMWPALQRSMAESGNELFVASSREEAKSFAIRRVMRPQAMPLPLASEELWHLVQDHPLLEIETLKRIERTLWGVEYAEGQLEQSLAAHVMWFALELLVVRPAVVVFWNGEQAIQRAYRAVLERMLPQVTVLFIERAPYPQFMYLSEGGLMAESSLSRVEPAPETHLAQSILNMETWWKSTPASQAPAIPASAKKVILFGGQIDEDSQCLFFSDYESNLSAFDAFCQKLTRLPNASEIYVLGKAHPKSGIGPEAYQKIIEANDLTGVWTADIGLAESFRVATHLAGVNSSMLFEGAMRGLPTLALGRYLGEQSSTFYSLDALTDWLEDQSPSAKQEVFMQKTEAFLRLGLFTTASPDFPGPDKLADAINERRPEDQAGLLQAYDHAAAMIWPKLNPVMDSLFYQSTFERVQGVVRQDFRANVHRLRRLLP